jgi:hypothetical protein
MARNAGKLQRWAIISLVAYSLFLASYLSHQFFNKTVKARTRWNESNNEQDIAHMKDQAWESIEEGTRKRSDEKESIQVLVFKNNQAWEVIEKFAKLQRDKLNTTSAQSQSIFEDVESSYPVTGAIISEGNGESTKTMIRPELIFPGSKDCTVYGMGIATDSGFEQQMSKFCKVHAFDCSVKPDAPSVRDQPFTFHPICIGEMVARSNVYMGSGDALRFSPLKAVMANLSHASVDLFKMDIEGGEWAVLENDILRDGMRPAHLLFELHTHCANPSFVPVELTRGRDKVAVNRLFAALHDAGYRVVSKQGNSGDPCCAEFSLVHVH